MFVRPKRLALLLTAFPLAVLLTSCESITAATSCASFAIITVSRDDVLTDETARQLLAHNRAYEVLCQ